MKPASTKAGATNPGALRAAFDDLYERFNRDVWSAAYARWLDADLALDITQEAFLRLWKQWQAGETIENPRAWLVRVARNLAEDYSKSAFHRNGTQAPIVMNSVTSTSSAPLEGLERQETFELVQELMQELSESDRQLLTLRYGFDYDATRIAEILEVNITAVHMRLSRARQRLADRLNAHGIELNP